MLTEDVISRKVEGPILKTVRLISKTNKLPKLANKVSYEGIISFQWNF